MSDDVVVRTELRVGDIGAVIALHGRLYAALCGWDHAFEAYVAATLGESMPRFDPRRERLWLVEKGTELLGCLGIVSRGPESAQLRWFLLDPSLRGRGLGRRLLNDALAFTRAVGYRHVMLWTTPGLPESAHLYEVVGFRKTEVKPGCPWSPSLAEERYDLTLG